eukprot:12427788-Karenia_brevis.AAC.1
MKGVGNACFKTAMIWKKQLHVHSTCGPHSETISIRETGESIMALAHESPGAHRGARKSPRWRMVQGDKTPEGLS